MPAQAKMEQLVDCNTKMQHQHAGMQRHHAGKHPSFLHGPILLPPEPALPGQPPQQPASPAPAAPSLARPLTWPVAGVDERGHWVFQEAVVV